MEIVTFTCIVNGSSIRWELSDVDRITVRTTVNNLNEPTMPQPGYTVTLTAFTDTTITSTLSRTTEDGITVSCDNPSPSSLTTVGSTTMNLVGEMYYMVIIIINQMLIICIFTYRSTRTTFHHISLYWEQFS